MIDWKEKFQNLRESAPIQCGGAHDRSAIHRIAETYGYYTYVDPWLLPIMQPGDVLLLPDAKHGVQLKELHAEWGKNYIVLAASGASLLVQLTKKK